MRLTRSQYRELVNTLVEVDPDVELAADDQRLVAFLSAAVETFRENVDVSQRQLDALARIVREQYA